MATKTRFPTADNTDGAWTPSTGTDLYACIDEAAQDDADYISCGTNNNNAYFGFTAFDVPAGATVNSVKVVCAARETGSTQVTGMLRVNGSNTADAGQNITNATPWQLITTTWTNNPSTSAAWTVDDVNGTGAHPLQYFGVLSRSIGASEAVDISWCYCEVDYTPAAGGSSIVVIVGMMNRQRV